MRTLKKRLLWAQSSFCSLVISKLRKVNNFSVTVKVLTATQSLQKYAPGPEVIHLIKAQPLTAKKGKELNILHASHGKMLLLHKTAIQQ